MGFNHIKKYAYLLLIFMQLGVSVCCLAQDSESILKKLLPEIPAELTEPAQRAAYLTQHFWDNYNFMDTTFLMTNQVLEHSFVDFINLLTLVPDDVQERSIQLLLQKSEVTPSVFMFIIQVSERYLYETASPFYNEERLVPFLQYALQSSHLDEFEKSRPAFLLNGILMNRIGTVANDFAYTLLNGETGTLHTLQADWTILYFNDPECDDCKLLIKQLSASTGINDRIESGKMKIITVYVNDDLEAWRKHASDVPLSWIYSYDAQQKINDENIYYIKHFPTLYLLDQDKKVMLKDISFDNLENYIKSHY